MTSLKQWATVPFGRRGGCDLKAHFQELAVHNFVAAGGRTWGNSLQLSAHHPSARHLRKTKIRGARASHSRFPASRPIFVA